ncbi:MAG TPA: hypothetical protein VG389_21295, partial [Myxococcota bacterium]|nr:hypothetical protein [Myxococcota bacterium]
KARLEGTLRLPHLAPPAHQGEVVAANGRPRKAPNADGLPDRGSWLVEPAGALRAPSARTREATVDAAFDVPVDAPPSFEGRLVVARWELIVAATVAGRALPLRAARTVRVLPRASGRTPGRPVEERSAQLAGETGAAAAWQTIRLESDRVAPGEEVRGQFTIHGLDPRQIDAVSLGLAWIEIIAGPRGAEATWIADPQTLEPFQAPADGDKTSFVLAVPATLTPTIETPVWGLSWCVELRVVRRGAPATVLRLPLTIVSRSARATRRGAAEREGGRSGATDAERPRDPEARRRAVWASGAAAAGLALGDDGALHGRSGEAEVRVERDEPPRGRPLLRGAVRWPPLHLALAVRPEGKLAAVLRRGLEVGEAEFDVHYLVRGRDAGQVRAVLDGEGRAAVAALGAVRVDDEGAVAERPERHAWSQAELRELCEQLLRLARAIEGARRDLPPPAALSDVAEDWRALAARLGGPLETARMRTAGRWRGAEAEVGVRWSAHGKPLGLEVTLRPVVPLPELYRQALDPIRPSGLAALAADLPAPAHAPLEALARAELRALTLRPEAASATLPAPPFDPARALPVLDDLAALCAALVPAAGPYR